MTNEELENEIINLQTKVSYLEDFMNQIQEVAVEQTKTIEKQREEIRIMAQRIHELSDFAEGDIPNRKPPHY